MRAYLDTPVIIPDASNIVVAADGGQGLECLRNKVCQIFLVRFEGYNRVYTAVSAVVCRYFAVEVQVTCGWKRVCASW